MHSTRAGAGRHKRRGTGPALSSIALVAALASGCGSTHRSTAPRFDPETTGIIAGTVRDKASRQPLSMVMVVIADVDSRRMDIPHGSSDSKGRYRIEGVPPGTYRVVAFYGDDATQRLGVKVSAGKSTGLDFDLAPAGTPTSASSTPSSDGRDGSRQLGYGRYRRGRPGGITGTLIEAETRAPLPGAVVTAFGPKLRNAIPAIADERGRFRMLGVPPGVYTLSVYYHPVGRGDIEFRRRNVVVMPGKTAVIELRLDIDAE